MSHHTNIRVYYEDTDAGAFVYYANYLKFCERGRSELLRTAGFENKQLLDERDIGFVVKRLNAEYHRPALLDDMLSVQTDVQAVKNACVIMDQRVMRGEELLFEMQVTLACIDIKKGKAVKMPQDIKEGFSQYE